jgi:hypothetical protein
MAGFEVITEAKEKAVTAFTGSLRIPAETKVRRTL